MKITDGTAMRRGALPPDGPQPGFFLDEDFQLTCAADGIGYQINMTPAEALAMWQELTRQLQDVLAVIAANPTTDTVN